MTPQEKARTLRPYIVKASASLDDTDALKAKELYDNWEAGKDYIADKRLRFDDDLYRVKQAHTSQSDWTPDIAASLYEKVPEQGQGTLDNPIPYSGNMALELGKYYTQDGVIYLCTRDTINPVYNALADLVGLYVEIVE
jgi:hypothetical protein